MLAAPSVVEAGLAVVLPNKAVDCRCLRVLLFYQFLCLSVLCALLSLCSIYRLHLLIYSVVSLLSSSLMVVCSSSWYVSS